MNDERCVLLGTYDERDQTPRRETWCGRTDASRCEWLFQDATHVLMANYRGPGSVSSCKKCLRAMRAVIDRELGET